MSETGKCFAECPYCKRLLLRPMPHNCNTGYRKNFHGRLWRAVYKSDSKSKVTSVGRPKCKTYEELQAENERLKEEPKNILYRVRYSINKLGKESTLFLIEQALKGEKDV